MAVSATGTLLDVDRDEFARAFAHRPIHVRHALVDDERLTLESIAKLADSLPSGSIERHRADLPMVMPGGALEVGGRPSETVLGIETNGCWMVLWYIDQSPEYKALLDAILEEAEACLDPSDGPTKQREAFLFLSAPNAVTPVHFDPEHNFLLQVKGTKDMNICPFPDRAAELYELDRYYAGGHRNLEAIPSESQTFLLTPGVGVYVPSFVPHWVKNGEEASISLSITFRTEESRRAERVHALNSRLRRLRLSPRPPGQSPRVDRAKEITYVALREWRPRLPARLKSS